MPLLRAGFRNDRADLKWLSVKRKYIPADPHNALVQPHNVPVRAARRSCRDVRRSCAGVQRRCGGVLRSCDLIQLGEFENKSRILIFFALYLPQPALQAYRSVSLVQLVRT